MTDKALGPPREKALAIRTYIEANEPALRKVTPGHIDTKKMNQLVFAELVRNPELLKCTPQSIFASLMECGQHGLEPDGIHAYILPRWSGKRKCMEANFQPSYKGLMQKTWRSDKITRFDARVVHEGDVFEYEFGLNESLVHRPANQPGADLVAVYSIAWLKDAPPQFKVMTREECDLHRDKYAPRNREGNIVGPWNTNYEAMCLKTVIIQNCRTIPCPPELGAVLSRDESYTDGPVVNGEYTVDDTPPASGDGGGGPPRPTNEESDPGFASPEDSPAGVSEPGAGGNSTTCPSCERAYALINGSGDVPGIGHAPDCAEA